MKRTIKNLKVSIADSSVDGMQRDAWVAARVKSHKNKGVSDAELTEGFSKMYDDIVAERDKAAKPGKESAKK